MTVAIETMTCDGCRLWRRNPHPDCYGNAWGTCYSSKIGMTLEAEVTGGITAENDSCPFWEARQ